MVKKSKPKWEKEMEKRKKGSKRLQGGGRFENKSIHKTRYCTAEGEILGMESLSVRVGGNWILDIWMD